jgi:recombination protein RecT
MTENKQLTVADTVRRMEPQFSELLRASGTDVKKFMNNALMALNDKPEIKAGQVSNKSVFDVCSRAANDGVVLDGREAAMVIGWNARTQQKEAQYRLMAEGVMKMIRRSPEISYIACQVVYENDVCEISFVTDAIPVSHTVDLKSGRGDPIGAYVVAKLASGEWTSPEYMSKAEVDAVRDAYSKKDKDGNFSKMWQNSWGEAARKTVLHRARKRLPLGEKASDALNRDADDDFEFEGGDDIRTEETKAKRQTRAAKAVKEAVAEPAAAQAPSVPSESLPPDDGVVEGEFTEDVDVGPVGVADDEPPL